MQSRRGCINDKRALGCEAELKRGGALVSRVHTKERLSAKEREILFKSYKTKRQKQQHYIPYENGKLVSLNEAVSFKQQVQYQKENQQLLSIVRFV